MWLPLTSRVPPPPKGGCGTPVNPFIASRVQFYRKRGHVSVMVFTPTAALSHHGPQLTAFSHSACKFIPAHLLSWRPGKTLGPPRPGSPPRAPRGPPITVKSGCPALVAAYPLGRPAAKYQYGDYSKQTEKRLIALISGACSLRISLKITTCFGVL